MILNNWFCFALILLWGKCLSHSTFDYTITTSAKGKSCSFSKKDEIFTIFLHVNMKMSVFFARMCLSMLPFSIKIGDEKWYISECVYNLERSYKCFNLANAVIFTPEFLYSLEVKWYFYYCYRCSQAIPWSIMVLKEEQIFRIWTIIVCW